MQRLQQLERPRDGERRRGHRALRLRAARVAQRGRRRAGSSARGRGRVGSIARTQTARSTGRRRSFATNTHDTKRSADVRARLDALSECAPEWQRVGCAMAPAQRNASRDGERATRAGHEHRIPPLPDARRDLAVAAAWPPSGRPSRSRLARDAARERLEQYMLKAVKRGKDAAPAGSSRRSLRDGAQAVHRRGAQPAATTRHFCSTSRASLATSPRWDTVNALARVARPPHVARCRRHLSGGRAVDLRARRSRQPASGRLRATAGAALGGTRGREPCAACIPRTSGPSSAWCGGSSTFAARMQRFLVAGATQPWRSAGRWPTMSSPSRGASAMPRRSSSRHGCSRHW